jgi:serine/threonine-protein kinase
MAEVHVACHRGEGDFVRVVAIKRMHAHLADDKSFVDMFLDEARLAASIDSPHVVKTMDVGRASDGSLYLVMELVVGVTLAELLADTVRAGTLVPVPVAVEIVAQAAEGLHEAHEAKSPTGEPLEIIHRDVSPQNVLIGQDGRVRMTDFGVARALHRRTSTVAGEVKGKFAYFSPEQALAGALDRRSDVFALGIVAWESVRAANLFKSHGKVEIIEQIRTKPIPRLDEVRHDVPAAVADAIARALERDPNLRFSTALDFAAALRSACASRPSDVASYVEAVSIARIDRLETKVKDELAKHLERTADPLAATQRERPRDLAREEPAAKSDAASSPSGGAKPALSSAPKAFDEVPNERARPAKRFPWSAAVFLAGFALVSAASIALVLYLVPTEEAATVETATPAAALDAGSSARCDREHRRECEALCGTGDEEACYYHAEAVADGTRGLRKDVAAGIELLRQSCARGWGRSCMHASTLFRREEENAGRTGWEAEYARLVTRGCDLGFGSSCRRLARALETGDAMPVRAEEAFRAAQRGCTLEDNYSCRMLADYYERGFGTEVDPERATEALATACSRFDKIACRVLRPQAPAQ